MKIIFFFFKIDFAFFFYNALKQIKHNMSLSCLNNDMLINKNLYTDLINNLKLFVSKYNKNQIKKQQITKQNLKNYTDPYFELLEKIEVQLKEIDGEFDFQVVFIKENPDLSADFIDIRKNFYRRIKAQLKKK